MQEKNWVGYGVLILVTVIWGSTFSVTKTALAAVPPLLFLAWRFSLAVLGLLLLNFRKLASLTKDELAGGIISGTSMSLGYIAQTVGMVFSTAAKAGFITGLAVVLVPLLGAVFFRRRPPVVVYIFAAVAAMGLALLSLDFSAGLLLNQGDLLLLICAVAFALNILFLGEYAPRCRVLMLTLVQVAITAIFCWIASSLLEQHVSFTSQVWAGLFYLAIAGTILTTVGQTWAQRSVSPERAALVFTLEPVFAAAFAFFLLGETLPPQGFWGSVLIMMGIIGAELASRRIKEKT
ncbi:MAG: DMT family transporter [Bacillota bacterium]|jgi:drug/metabolite transporter (DMT)-like permease|nr:DMT family transporter [Bacillota bacterium]HPZ21440.1 DMT family transporter [Bacillota bacterium]HQD19301.1 DMT family transporter [Bacillota bacterium]